MKTIRLILIFCVLALVMGGCSLAGNPPEGTGEGTPAEITGKVRIIVTDYNETKIFPLFEHDEELLHGDLNDKQKLIPLPEKRPMIGEDSYIKIQVKPASAHSTAGAGNDNLGWADNTESLIKLPVTVYE